MKFLQYKQLLNWKIGIQSHKAQPGDKNQIIHCHNINQVLEILPVSPLRPTTQCSGNNYVFVK